jgi:hypothetical protein
MSPLIRSTCCIKECKIDAPFCGCKGIKYYWDVQINYFNMTMQQNRNISPTFL